MNNAYIKSLTSMTGSQDAVQFEIAPTKTIKSMTFKSYIKH